MEISPSWRSRSCSAAAMWEGPPRRPFFVRDEAGLEMARVLWKYCRAMGRTPREAWDDPDLPFNLTVMYGAEAARAMRWALSTQQLGEDPFLIGRIALGQQLAYEDQ